MRAGRWDPEEYSENSPMHHDLPILYDQLTDLRTMARRLEADTILLSGDRDAALREITHLRLLLVRSLPAIGIRAVYGEDSAASELSMQIRAALRT